MIFTLIDDNLGSEDGLLAGNESDVETLAVIEMINLLKRGELTSTSAKLITYTGGKLRNVKGSTPDRRDVDGNENESWRQLVINVSNGLIDNNTPCYAIDPAAPAPTDCTHPQFKVGGHVTPDKNGNAWEIKDAQGNVIDRKCYLIPWCSWHNSTARDQYEYDINLKNVVELSGYTGKLNLITFMARLAVEKEQIVFLLKKQNGWEISYFDHENDFQNQCHIAANKNYPFVAFKKGPTS